MAIDADPAMITEAHRRATDLTPQPCNGTCSRRRLALHVTALRRNMTVSREAAFSQVKSSACHRCRCSINLPIVFDVGDAHHVNFPGQLVGSVPDRARPALPRQLGDRSGGDGSPKLARPGGAGLTSTNCSNFTRTSPARSESVRTGHPGRYRTTSPDSQTDITPENRATAQSITRPQEPERLRLSTPGASLEALICFGGGVS